jgi:hypothetical protein
MRVAEKKNPGSRFEGALNASNVQRVSALVFQKRNIEVPSTGGCYPLVVGGIDRRGDDDLLAGRQSPQQFRRSGRDISAGSNSC